jgi:hypothetical protein
VRTNPSGEKGIETLGDGGGRKDRVRTREMEAADSAVDERGGGS